MAVDTGYNGVLRNIDVYHEQTVFDKLRDQWKDGADCQGCYTYTTVDGAHLRIDDIDYDNEANMKGGMLYGFSLKSRHIRRM